MSVFVIADTHFGHANIIKYCNRPFIKSDDTVFHLGDVGIGSQDYMKSIVSQLNGHKHLICGNHDTYSDEFYRDCGFETVSRFPIIWNNFFIFSHTSF